MPPVPESPPLAPPVIVLRQRYPALGPFGKGSNRRVQFRPRLRQRVVDANRRSGVNHSFHESRFFQLAQPFGQ